MAVSPRVHHGLAGEHSECGTAAIFWLTVSMSIGDGPGAVA